MFSLKSHWEYPPLCKLRLLPPCLFLSNLYARPNPQCGLVDLKNYSLFLFPSELMSTMCWTICFSWLNLPAIEFIFKIPMINLLLTLTLWYILYFSNLIMSGQPEVEISTWKFFCLGEKMIKEKYYLKSNNAVIQILTEAGTASVL